MKKIYCIRFTKYVKIKESKILYIWSKALVISTFCEKCSSNNDKIFKEEKSIKILKICSLIDNMDK